MKFAVLGFALVVTACASGRPELDVARVEATCARWCEKKFPSCAFDGAIVAAKNATLGACQKQYMTCVETCPPR